MGGNIKEKEENEAGVEGEGRKVEIRRKNVEREGWYEWGKY